MTACRKCFSDFPEVRDTILEWEVDESAWPSEAEALADCSVLLPLAGRERYDQMQLLLKSMGRLSTRSNSLSLVTLAYTRQTFYSQRSKFASQSEMSNPIKLWIDCDAGMCLFLALMTSLHDELFNEAIKDAIDHRVESIRQCPS